MAIQVRRGNYADFDPDKMLPGEWATATSGDPNADDGMAVYMCFKAGKVKRMATYDDMKQNIEDATSDVADDVAEQLEENINEAIQLAQSASSAANSAAEKANSASQLAQSASSAANSAASAAQEAAQEAQNAADNVKNDFYGARSSFPITGETKKLYVDNTVTPSVIYTWDEEKQDYVRTSGKEGFLEESGSGTTILLEDQKSPKSFRSLEVYGKSTQDGTPSPENPVPIETAGSDGTVDVKLTGAQLFDVSKFPTKSVNGASIKNNGDGSLTFYSDATNPGFVQFYELSHEEFADLFRTGRIYLKGSLNEEAYFEVQILSESGNFYIRDNSYKDISEEIYSNCTAKFLFHIPEGTYVPKTTIKPMVYQDGDGTWEPYKDPQSLSISTPNGLPGIPVKSGGNYTDESGQQWIADVKDYGTGKYTQNCAIVTFDGSEDEDWVVGDTSIGKRYILKLQDEVKVSDTTSGATSMNSNLPLGRKGDTYTLPNIYAITESSHLLVSLNGTESLSEFKQYLQQNPMTLLYQLSIPIVTDISAEEMEAYKALKTYTPTTVISSDSGVWMEADLVDSDILYPRAENTSYDNSTSGLTSDNVQAAIDENAEAISALNSSLSNLDSRFAWKDLGNVALGNQSVDMSSLGDDDFNEICISVWTGSGSGERDYLCTIPKVGIAATDANAPTVVVGGYYINPNDYGLAMVRVSRQSVSIASFYHGGQQITGDNRSLRVRYR